jgi:hypothetical protein
VVLRGLGLAVALGLAGVAVWLVVTSTTHKGYGLGVLAGLWAALLGAFVMFGPRYVRHDADEPVPSTALALRATDYELERAEEAAARRAHEARLEAMLRREIRTAVTAEVTALREEIAALRSELLEKVGGQLRLERIETTRVIGSDLEALQAEVRQLKAAAAQDAELALGRERPAEAPSVRHIVEPARVRPVSRQTAEVQAEVQPARMTPEPEPEPRPAATPPPPAPPPAGTAGGPAAATGAGETTGPIRTDATAVPPPSPSPRPQPAPAEPIVLPLQQQQPAGDEFAGLPRIRPFTDFELDPAGPDAGAARPAAGPPPEHGAAADQSPYTGRRRRGDEPEPGTGRHARAADEDEPGRRHRRDEDSADDLLARLLAREGIRR